MDSVVILAFTGPAGAGKSTAAEYLSDHHGFKRTRFADPLKAMVRGFLYTTGVPSSRVERMIEGDLKEVPTVDFGGKSPRYVMQTIGTEWGRDIICPSLWIDAWTLYAKSLIASGQRRIVVEDCRFANEVEAVTLMGGLVVEIKAEHGGIRGGAGGHVSEGQDLQADITLWNNGPVDIFQERLAGLVDRYAKAA